MDHSFHNIQRIIELINRKWITVLLILKILLLLKMIKLYLSKVKTNLNKFVFISYQFHDILCFSNADTSHVFHVLKNVEDIYLSLK